VCDCDDEEIQDGDRPITLTPAMIRRMIAVEAARPGVRVPAHSWDVFLGRASGGIPFVQLLRLQHCRQLATDEERRARRMFVRARSRSRRSLSLQCAEVR